MNVSLRVTKSYPSDLGRGIARLDPDTLLKLQLSPGDIVEIDGNKNTAAVVWRADRQDWGLEYIRIDGFTRQNAGVSIGDRVRVRSAETKEAIRITLAPAEGIPIVMDDDSKDMVRRQVLKRAVVAGDIVPIMSSAEYPFMGTSIFGEAIPLVCLDTRPDDVIIITESTEIDFRDKPIKHEVRATGITYEDIGGLRDEIQRVREMIELPLRHPEIFQQLGIGAPKGVLLHGPPGTGKTLIAKAVANESGADFYYIAGPEIMSKYYGESEQRLREIFDEARENSPSIIFIDEVDSIAPKREEVTGEVERRVVAQLLTMMDGLEDRGEIIVIGATNRVNAIDPALRRPGRFDREIELVVPKSEDRLEILQIHTRSMPLNEEVMLETLSAATHGFVGADLSALCREAAMHALRRALPDIDLDEEHIPREVLEMLTITNEDFKWGLKETEPSAMREVLVEIPDVSWDDIGGMDQVKQEIVEAIEWPLTTPEKFTKMGIRPPKAVLLFGAPGTGKTLVAKAVASQSGANFISVKGPQLLSKWVGESEKAVREIFRRARQVSPSIIFFDEIDAMAPIRGGGEGSKVSEQVVNQLLSEMDGLEKLEDVIVIGATNRPDIIDPALLRPGRFDRIVLVGSPDRDGRLEILKIHTSKMPLSEDVEVEELSEITNGYVGSDIEALCREAAMFALREDLDKVEMCHFREALKKVRPSITESMVGYYERIKEEFGSKSSSGEVRSYIGFG